MEARHWKKAEMIQRVAVGLKTPPFGIVVQKELLCLIPVADTPDESLSNLLSRVLMQVTWQVIVGISTIGPPGSTTSRRSLTISIYSSQTQHLLREEDVNISP